MAYRFAKLAFASLVIPAIIAAPIAQDIVYETDIDVTYETDIVTVGAAAAATSAPVAVVTAAPAAAPVVAAPVAAAPAAPAAAVAAPAKAAAAIVAAPVAAPKAPAATGSASGSFSLSGGKAGLAYNDVSLLSAFGTKASWAYNWVSSAGGSMPAGVQYVPMLHDTSAEWTSQWGAQSAGASACLAFNEPDVNGISPADAAASYQSVFQAQAPSGALLGSPATTSTQGAAGKGLDWLTQFMSACSSCKIDFVAAHWYGMPGQLSNFQQYISDVHAQTGKPVWVTEYALNPWDNYSDIERSSFIAEATQWLEQQDYVQRYSPYMVGTGQGMFTAASSLASAFLSVL